MSDEHKAALAEGRTGTAVRDYLEALEQHKPKRGRKRTPESIKKRNRRDRGRARHADPLKRLQLIQERIDLAAELESARDRSTSSGSRRTSSPPPRATASARASATPRGASWACEAATLKRAGISRAS
jgi:hypothetical protein